MNTAVAKKSPRTAPEVVWFVARGSVLKGPFTTEQLREKVQKRELSHFDFCWRQGYQEWRPLLAIEEFERRNRNRKLPTYPTVDVPAGGPAARATTSSNVVPIRPETDPKRIQVQFAKMRRHSITAYEWAFALLFAVGLAYFASSFALNGVRDEVLRRFAILALGQPQPRGEAAGAVSPEFWQPLYSAPSFGDVAQAPLDPFRAVDGVHSLMPVVVEGQPERSADGALRVGGYLVRAPSSLDIWRAADHGLDPAFSKPVQVQGHLSPTNAHVILVQEPGDPALLRDQR